MKRKLREFDGPPFKAAIVTWEDTHVSSEDWDDPFSFDNPDERIYIIHQIGWIIKDDKVGIVMSGAYSQEGEVESSLVIPRCAIKHIRYLK
jgi:hypothetical protein